MTHSAAIALDAAAGIVADETPELELLTGGMPKSRFDFDFDLLHHVLYQDKDYEIAYLSNRSIAKPGDLEQWFEDFQTPAPRDPREGSTGKRCRPRQRRGQLCGMQPHRGQRR